MCQEIKITPGNQQPTQNQDCAILPTLKTQFHSEQFTGETQANKNDKLIIVNKT